MWLKRLFDIVLSATALLVLAPLLMVLALMCLITQGRPILLAQPRPGLHGRVFTMYKFRSMTDARGPDGALLPDAERITPFGRFIRSTSLDELPELWSILRGDMSLVGPRPLLVRYLERYTPEQARRHEMRPGLTGWAQVNGRNALSWDEKFALDVWYVDNWSLWLDVRIILLTVWQVVRRQDIAAQDHVTMPEFMGSQPPPHRQPPPD